MSASDPGTGQMSTASERWTLPPATATSTMPDRCTPLGADQGGRIAFKQVP